MKKTSRRAATAVEYGLIAGGILLAIILGVTHTGTSLANLFGGMSNSVQMTQPTYIPGVTGVDSIPSWVTTACQVPTITQLQVAATQTSTGSGTTFGCIPANSKVTGYTLPDGYATSYYVTTPGSTNQSLYAVSIPAYNQVFSYATYNDPVGGQAECTGVGSTRALELSYSYGSYTSSTGACTTNGLVPVGASFGTPGQPSMIGFLDGLNYYHNSSVSITNP